MIATQDRRRLPKSFTVWYPLEDRYGQWSVKQETRHRRGETWHVVCLCDCGTERPVATSSLRSGMSQGCGCIRTREGKTTPEYHGETHHPLYTRWTSMIERCHNPKNKAFARYGARGISVCERWRFSFTAYAEDVGLPPSPEMSLDRIDNDGPYEPGNVRWTDRTTQMRNTRANRLLTLGDETLCMQEWATRLGVAWSAIDHRLKAGWSIEEALTRPPHRGKRAMATA